ncbi:TetR/AcrR family transcriptional regulator [Acinetobacter baumannii]|uniref:TetR/AcrR family transcriptional regulator n=1 Tax=Acinetobacter baumannii TaxID=470 RepID=UPI000DCFD7B6|nr:TetR/AcrR family transcriptional regulator [Acinetobacter baumannii]
MSFKSESRPENSIAIRLMEAAANLLLEEGPSALSARRISQSAGVSTQGLYTHFGSMGNLVRAVVDDGFQRLGQALDSIAPSDDPINDLIRQTFAYVNFGRNHHALYSIMFGVIPLGNFGAHTSDELSRGRYTLDKVAIGMERAIIDGRFKNNVPFFLANQWWIMVHGYVLTESVGYMNPANGEKKVLLPALYHLFLGMGDNEARIKVSFEQAQILIG